MQRDGHFLSRKSLVEKKALILNSITRQVRGTPATRAALQKNNFKLFNRASSLLTCRYIVRVLSTHKWVERTLAKSSILVFCNNLFLRNLRFRKRLIKSFAVFLTNKCLKFFQVHISLHFINILKFAKMIF
jgi:hypothetical protein